MALYESLEEQMGVYAGCKIKGIYQTPPKDLVHQHGDKQLDFVNKLKAKGKTDEFQNHKELQ